MLLEPLVFKLLSACLEAFKLTHCLQVSIAYYLVTCYYQP
jgi:hypothetical protein